MLSFTGASKVKVVIGIELGWGFGRLVELQNSKRLSTATKVIERLLAVTQRERSSWMKTTS
jgi:hypothetical protein